MVFGPILPSTAPALNPLSFSACCSWLTCELSACCEDDCCEATFDCDDCAL